MSFRFGKHRLKRLIALLATLAALLVGGVALSTPASAANVCGYTSSEPTLRQGSSGTAVREAQCQLNLSLYYTKITVDGAFGPATDNAVRTFQSCVGITVDGVIGPTTWSYLYLWSTSSYWLYC